MTRKSFYRSLARIAGKYKWKVSDGHLRAYKKKNDLEYCPLEVRSFIKYGDFSYSNNGDISKKDWQIIIGAADFKLKDLSSNAERRCRKALFRATGANKRGL